LRARRTGDESCGDVRRAAAGVRGGRLYGRVKI